MEFSEIDLLLDPTPLRLEMGVERLPSGVLHVAARTDMHRCNSKMFEWWFRYFTTSEQYAWWHPGDHVSLQWDARYQAGKYIGATCVVDERLAGHEVYRLFVHFIDPTEIFSKQALQLALDRGDVCGVVTAHIGVGNDPPHTPDRRPLGARVLHVPRDTPFGCVLRSHFYLGIDLTGMRSPKEIEAAIPDNVGLGLMKHAYTEFSFLSGFLPSLYIAENRDSEPPPLPW